MYGRDAAWQMVLSGFNMVEAALRFGEMVTASNSVIQARAEIIGAATRNPLDGDYDELGRMIPEKLAGFSEAGMAVARMWWAVQRDVGERLLDAGKMLLGWPPTPLAAMNAAEGMADFNVRTVRRAMEVSGVAIEPLHERATANARRLGR
jgi:hypothetical protein